MTAQAYEEALGMAKKNEDKNPGSVFKNWHRE